MKNIDWGRDGVVVEAERKSGLNTERFEEKTNGPRYHKKNNRIRETIPFSAVNAYYDKY